MAWRALGEIVESVLGAPNSGGRPAREEDTPAGPPSAAGQDCPCGIETGKMPEPVRAPASCVRKDDFEGGNGRDGKPGANLAYAPRMGRALRTRRRMTAQAGMRMRAGNHAAAPS